MKSIKNYTFSLVTLVTLLFTFSSCDALTEALSKEVEIEAPAINFSVGGATQAPQQKVGAATEVVWLDQQIDIKTKLEEELEKNSLTIDKVKTLLVTKSSIALVVPASGNFDFGNIKIYIDNVAVASGYFAVTTANSGILLDYTEPYSIFGSLGKGAVQLKITSDKAKPALKYDMKLINTYVSKISLL